MRFRNLALLASLMLVAAPAIAQPAPPHLNLCPPTIRKTCLIGYVTAANEVYLMLSSVDLDPLLSQEAAVAPLDLSKDIGGIVMLDATDKDGTIANAELVSVADPLLTALYVSIFNTATPE